MLKKIKAIILTSIITLNTSISSISASAFGYYPNNVQTFISGFEKHEVFDDKGMYAEFRGSSYFFDDYKMFCDDPCVYMLTPLYNTFQFIVDDSIEYNDEVHNRIVEIFREFYPEENYEKEFIPFLTCCVSRTDDNKEIIKYTATFPGEIYYMPPSDSLNSLEAKKYSHEVMLKLNEEKFISAFYDVGEVYDIAETRMPSEIRYSKKTEEELQKIEDYIEQNNLPCSLEFCNTNLSKLVFNNDYNKLEQLLFAVDIYSATSIACGGTGWLEASDSTTGKNALDELNGSTIIFGTPTISGDLDLNNEQGIADIVALTKYNTSAELFPITDATALANADVNQDGTIDSIDTSLLIEIMLGTFESAV